MKKEKAFTLIEILVVIAIIGVVLTFAIPSVRNAYKNSQKTALDQEINFINSRVIREFNDFNGLTMELNAINNSNSPIVTALQNNNTIPSNSTFTFLASGYENDSVITNVINNIPGNNSQNQYYIILPNNNPSIGSTTTLTLNLNKPIKIIAYSTSLSNIYVYENGVDISENYITK